MANATYSGIDSLEAVPDYARYDRLWQRVAPTMNPYPEVRAAQNAAVPVAAMQQPPAMPQTAAARQTTPVQQTTARDAQLTETEKQELTLPGAEANPCCMGSEAQDLVEVLEGFAQEEMADAATYRQLARFAPNRMAAAALREMGRGADQRGRELAAAYYLITGEQKRITSAAVVLPRLPYRELLRERYHATVCNAFNYARAEDATPDPCLQRLLRRFSEESYAASERLLRLLAQVQ